MFVISTYKRPVPLRHFVYTGNSKLTSNELFEIVSKQEIDKQRYGNVLCTLVIPTDVHVRDCVHQ